MISQSVEQLDSNARLLLQQAVMNPSIIRVFMLEKVAAQKLMLDMFQTDTETDSQYLRKIETQRKKIIYIDEILAFFATEASRYSV